MCSLMAMTGAQCCSRWENTLRSLRELWAQVSGAGVSLKHCELFKTRQVSVAAMHCSMMEQYAPQWNG